jgi:hypothetical protein
MTRGLVMLALLCEAALAPGCLVTADGSLWQQPRETGRDHALDRPLADVARPGDARRDGSTDRPRLDVLGPDTKPCVLGPFGGAKAVAAVNVLSWQWGPSISASGLRLYFSGDGDVWVAERSSLSAAFGAPARITGLNPGATEENPSASSDELELYYDDGSAITRATRATTSAAFTSPKVVPITGVPSTVKKAYEPYLSRDGTTLLFRVDLQGGDLVTTTRVAGGGFVFTRTLAELNTSSGEDGAATLSSDNLEIFFNSDADGKFRIYRAQRSATGGTFSAPTVVSELDGPGIATGDPDLSADGRTIYYVVVVPSVSATIWTATRGCL